jgi:hypothetical protein
MHCVAAPFFGLKELKEIQMNKRSVALLLGSLLLAGGAAAQDKPITHGEPAEQTGPSGVTRDGDLPSADQRSDAPGAPGAASTSNRLATPSGASGSGATGTGAGNNWLDSGASRQPGTGFKSSGSVGPAPGSGASEPAGTGGIGGGTTGGSMR